MPTVPGENGGILVSSQLISTATLSITAYDLFRLRRKASCSHKDTIVHMKLRDLVTISAALLPFTALL